MKQRSLTRPVFIIIVYFDENQILWLSRFGEHLGYILGIHRVSLSFCIHVIYDNIQQMLIIGFQQFNQASGSSLELRKGCHTLSVSTPGAIMSFRQLMMTPMSFQNHGGGVTLPSVSTLKKQLFVRHHSNPALLFRKRVRPLRSFAPQPPSPCLYKICYPFKNPWTKWKPLIYRILIRF